jgi:nicotinamidase-related amidase
VPVLEREKSAFIVVDVQERLAPAIGNIGQVLARIGLLIDAALELGVPLAFTEQYPAGLGPTMPELRQRAPAAPVISKMHFQASLEPGLPAWLETVGARQVVVAGTETHVCVLQTTLGLLGGGRAAFLVADATGSRREEDRVAAIDRLRMAGCEIVTTEMVAFEWLRRAGTDQFRRLLPKIRDGE